MKNFWIDNFSNSLILFPSYDFFVNFFPKQIFKSNTNHVIISIQLFQMLLKHQSFILLFFIHMIFSSLYVWMSHNYYTFFYILDWAYRIKKMTTRKWVHCLIQFEDGLDVSQDALVGRDGSVSGDELVQFTEGGLIFKSGSNNWSLFIYWIGGSVAIIMI